MMNTSLMIDPHEIRQRAYARWQRRGCPEGAPETDWFEAEQELAGERLLEEHAGAKAIAAAAVPVTAGAIPEESARTAKPPRPAISRKPTTRGTKISTPLAPAVDGAKAASAAPARATRRRAVASSR